MGKWSRSFKRVTRTISQPFVSATQQLQNTAKNAAEIEVDNWYHNCNSIGKAAQIVHWSGVNVINTIGHSSEEAWAGTAIVGEAMTDTGAQIRDGVVLVAEWVEANACQIGMNVALGTAIGAYFYSPEPPTQAKTTAQMAPISATALTFICAKESLNAVIVSEACVLTATAIVEAFWLVPQIKNGVGSNNKDLLIYALAFMLNKAIEKYAGALIVPQSAAAIVAGIVASLFTQVVCERKIPSSTNEWARGSGMTAADGI